MPTTQDWDDLQQYARAGSHEAFARLVNRYSGAVFAMCHRQLADRHLAEDATQAVFLILSARARRLGPRTVLSGWLFQTARYVCANARRARRRREFHERQSFVASGQGAGDSGGTPEPNDLAPLVDEAVASLRACERDALLLRYVHQLSTADVAAELNLTEPAARKRLSRAVERLRAFFERRGVTAEAGAIVAVLAPSAWPVPSSALASAILSTCTASAADGLAAAAGATGGASASASAPATALAKGATIAMNLHALKTTVAAAGALVLVTAATVGAVTTLVNLNLRDTTQSPPPAQALAATDYLNASSGAAQADPTVEEAQRLAKVGDWSGAIDVYGEYLRTLTVHQYRDKKDFDWILDEFEQQRRPRTEADYQPLRAVADQKLDERPPGDPDIWRLHGLLAAIARKSGKPAADQQEHLEQAIAAYPPEVEGDPSRHSSLQHLYNSVALLIAERNVEEAEKYLLDRFEEDERFVYVFLPPWQQLYAKRNQPQRFDKFVQRVLEIYPGKAERNPDLEPLLSEYAQQTQDMRAGN